MTWVIDSTVVLNFGKAESLWIVDQALIETKMVVEEVKAEILHPASVVSQLRDALAGGWLHLHRLSLDAEHAAMEALRQQRPRLGDGECASLAVCVAYGWALASDDRDARRVAASRGVPVTGTTGILLRAVRRELIELPMAESVFERMIAAGYHAPVTRLSDLMVS